MSLPFGSVEKDPLKTLCSYVDEHQSLLLVLTGGKGMKSWEKQPEL